VIVKEKAVGGFFVVGLLVLSTLGMSMGLSFSNNAEVEGSGFELTSFAGGSGTEDDPYLIENVHQLQNMSEDLEAHYELIDDVDASETKNWNDGKGFEPVGEMGENLYFNGSLDGKGHEIKGFYINRPENDSVGLFGYMIGPVNDVRIVDAEVKGNNDVGLLVGHLDLGGVSFSYGSGKVSGNSSTGGLVGYTSRGIVRKSYADVDVIGEDGITGGLVGLSSGTRVFNSYALGNTTGVSNVGGLIGRVVGWSPPLAPAVVTNSYSAGYVMGKEDVGGLVGYSGLAANISGSFWDIESSGQNESDGGTGKTTAEMKDVATFTDLSTEGLDEPWDFVGNPNDDEGDEDIWDIDGITNDGYPFLSGQVTEKFSLTVNVEGEGTTDPEPGTHIYEEGEEVSVEAFPDDG